jgi:16S rRNA (guanine966-N2)-methyltransferase
VFDALKDEVRGAVFVDLYAAAGGVGIEALSRGAARVHFVERDPAALAALEANLAACGVEPDRCRIHRMDVARFVAAGGISDPAVRVVYADPPYEGAQAEIDSLLALLDEKPYAHVRFLVVEHAGALSDAGRRWWRPWRTKRFGDTCLTYFTPTRGSGS